MVSLDFFYWHNPSGRTMALGLTQPLTEMSTRNISWGKGGRCVGLTTLPPSCADCLKIWEPQPPGTLRACQGLYRDCFTFTFTFTPNQVLVFKTLSGFSRLSSVPAHKSLNSFSKYATTDSTLYSFQFITTAN